MVRQSFLSARACLDARVLHIDANNSVSLTYLRQQDLWHVQHGPRPDSAAWGQSGKVLLSLQWVESSKQADGPTSSSARPSLRLDNDAHTRRRYPDEGSFSASELTAEGGWQRLVAAARDSSKTMRSETSLVSEIEVGGEDEPTSRRTHAGWHCHTGCSVVSAHL